MLPLLTHFTGCRKETSVNRGRKPNHRILYVRISIGCLGAVPDPVYSVGGFLSVLVGLLVGGAAASPLIGLASLVAKLAIDYGVSKVDVGQTMALYYLQQRGFIQVNFAEGKVQLLGQGSEVK